MTKYFMKLAYEGTAYSGWQRQPNAITVQQIIEDELTTLLSEKTTILGCGRTDAGVHSSQYFAHFEPSMAIDVDTILFKLNNMIPPDIVIEKIGEVPDNLHARYSARSRAYIYTISKKKPLLDRNHVYHFYLYNRLDKEKMKAAAALVAQQSEFKAFCKTGTDVKTFTCHIQESRLVFDEENERIYYHITANRFLRAMVRLLTGMILNVGRGSVTLEEVKHAFESQERLKLGWSVPARGLSLCKITYPEELLDPAF